MFICNKGEKMSVKKMTNTEVMKLIKELEEQKQLLIDFEKRNAFARYSQEDKHLADVTPYDIVANNNAINSLDRDVRILKHLLNVANTTVFVPEFNMTIGQCLVYMAQLTQSINRYMSLANTDKVTREASGYSRSSAEFKEARYDVAIAREMLNVEKNNLSKLQMAIDKANLTNEIDVPLGE